MPLEVRICDEDLLTRSSFVSSRHCYGIDVCTNWLWSLYLFPRKTWPSTLVFAELLFSCCLRLLSDDRTIRNRRYRWILDGYEHVWNVNYMNHRLKNNDVNPIVPQETMHLVWTLSISCLILYWSSFYIYMDFLDAVVHQICLTIFWILQTCQNTSGKALFEFSMRLWPRCVNPTTLNFMICSRCSAKLQHVGYWNTYAWKLDVAAGYVQLTRN